jgi:hypothetical protein
MPRYAMPRGRAEHVGCYCVCRCHAGDGGWLCGNAVRNPHSQGYPQRCRCRCCCCCISVSAARNPWYLPQMHNLLCLLLLLLVCCVHVYEWVLQQLPHGWPCPRVPGQGNGQEADGILGQMTGVHQLPVQDGLRTAQGWKGGGGDERCCTISDMDPLWQWQAPGGGGIQSGQATTTTTITTTTSAHTLHPAPFCPCSLVPPSAVPSLWLGHQPLSCTTVVKPHLSHLMHCAIVDSSKGWHACEHLNSHHPCTPPPPTTSSTQEATP